MADDIGEALDFVVGLAQIGGALVDGGFEIEIVVAQLRFGLVARARRAPHQEDRNAGQRDDEAGAGDGHDRGEPLAAIRSRGAQREQPIFLGAHRVGDVADRCVQRVAGAGLAQQCDAAGAFAAFDEVDLLRELAEPRLDRRAQPLPFSI